MVNVVRPPGQFQVYDIVFRAPVYLDGKAIDPGYVTVFINGVLVQDCTPLEGPTGHMKRTVPGPFPAKGPIKLQDHGNPMKFRNIWYRKLPPRPVQGGLDGGFLTEETVTAKRGQIAAEIRQDAERMSGDPVARMLRLLESLEYQQDPATWQKVSSMAADYLERLKQTSADKLASRKDQAKQVSAAFDFMKRFRLVPPDFAPAAGLAQFIKDQKWDKK
jgi:hypothetical protein